MPIWLVIFVTFFYLHFNLVYVVVFYPHFCTNCLISHLIVTDGYEMFVQQNKVKKKILEPIFKLPICDATLVQIGTGIFNCVLPKKYNLVFYI